MRVWSYSGGKLVDILSTFDYPDTRLSGLLTCLWRSLDNQGCTVDILFTHTRARAHTHTHTHTKWQKIDKELPLNGNVPKPDGWVPVH